MSAKLDQSLEDIVMTDRKGPRGRHSRRVPKPKARVAAPAGGISKNSKAAKGPKSATKVSVLAAAGPRDGGKILVSGLPTDVNEPTIKDYFQTQIGNVKKVVVVYGPNGKSRGEATIHFNNTAAAAKAAHQVNGLTIDGTRKIKVEVIMGADKTSEPKSLAERVSQPKAGVKAAKKAAAGRGKVAAGGKSGRAAGRGKNPRPKSKTVEELDAEMTDYFGNGADSSAVPAGGAATQPAAGGDAMDEIQ